MQHKQAVINKKIVELLAPYGVAPDACPLVYFQSPTVFDVMTFGSDFVWNDNFCNNAHEYCGTYFADADNHTAVTVMLYAETTENSGLFVELTLYYYTYGEQHALRDYAVIVKSSAEGY